jgi:hypothetical protein
MRGSLQVLMIFGSGESVSLIWSLSRSVFGFMNSYELKSKRREKHVRLSG